MNFGSKFVYKYEHSESESVSEDDNDEEMHSSIAVKKTDGEKEHDTSVKETSAQRFGKRRRLRKPDTNIISIKFDQLLEPGEMHAGDPVYCNGCRAIASHLSKIETVQNEESTENQLKWKCEFCPTINIVDIEQAELPRREDATYLLTPAPVVHGSDISGIDDSVVLFVIDISGSMSSTTLIHGAFNLPNAVKQQERAAEAFGGAHIVRQRHQTYVSRLQGVQMAVDANLDKLFKENPTRRAALLTFNHELTYYGDGTRDEPLVIRGDKLNSIEELTRIAKEEMAKELKPVSATKTKLTERVYDLEEGGQTALGPAVIFALNIAAKRQGSRIVICTDGLANRGLGNLEAAQDEKAEEHVKLAALEAGNHFYADVTERARAKGVSISVTTIKGTTCLLPVIGQLADGTGGNVTIVDLLNMREEFASILEQKVIATNVEALLIVHRALYVRNPDSPDEKLDTIKRDVGNVTKQTEVTFEYGIKNKEEVKEKYNINMEEVNKLPFQVQVNYTAADGSKALRVLTQLKDSTSSREEAENNALRWVIAENHIRSTAKDIMVAGSDEDEYMPGAYVTRATPIAQRQHIAYMTNLNSRARSHGKRDEDQFNERRWIKTTTELKSQVESSRSKRSSPAAALEPISESSGGSIFSTLTNKVSRIFSAKSKDATTEDQQRTEYKTPAKKSYGFATSNLRKCSDQHSENLYRYKNISSDYMRSSSPTRDESDDDSASGATLNARQVRIVSPKRVSTLSTSKTGRFKPKVDKDSADQPKNVTDTDDDD